MSELKYRPDGGGSIDLWNVGTLIPVHTALQPEDSHLYSHRREDLKS
jgi:hypothetical protein